MTVTAVTALAHLCMTSQVFEKLCLVAAARVASASLAVCVTRPPGPGCVGATGVCRVRLILPHALHYIIALMRSQIEAIAFKVGRP